MIKKKNFVIVTGDFVRTGGMDQANYALAEYLADHPEIAKSVHLVAHRADSGLISNARIVFHQVPRLMNSYWLSGPLLNHHAQRVNKSLGQSTTNTRPYLVVNGGNCRAEQTRLNWVHYVHAAYDPSVFTGYRPGFARRLKMQLAHRDFLRQERIAFQQSDLFIANSRLTASHLMKFYGVNPNRIHVVYYGTDRSRFHPITNVERYQARESLGLCRYDERPIAVFVGALGDSRKGFDLLFEAWTVFSRESGDSARLLVVGSGASLPYYRSQARRLNLSGSMEFLGFRADVPRILAAADLLISPVRYEAYGLNVHEALCRGLPVLVSRNAGISERIIDFSEEAADRLCITDPLNTVELAQRLSVWRSAPNSNLRLAEHLGWHLARDSWTDQMQKLTAITARD